MSEVLIPQSEVKASPKQKNPIQEAALASPIEPRGYSVMKEAPQDIHNSTLTTTPLIQENLQSTETISQKPFYTSTFTHDISDSLSRIGIRVDYVNPTPLGEGANHLVYSYLLPQEKPRVIKIAKTKSVTTLTHGGSQGEKEGIELAKKTFLNYAADTEVKNDPKKQDKYVVIQEAVKGKPISNKTILNSVQMKEQLTEIVQLNRKLYKEKGMCLDFIGMGGFKGWFKKQFKKLFFKNSEFEVSNIIENEEGKLKIIDFEYFDLNSTVSLKKRMINTIGMEVNRFFMKHYFHLDIKKG